MGQLIRKLADVKLRGNSFSVEENAPNIAGADKLIHIQNERFRLEVSEKDFVAMLGGLLFAKKNFEIVKGYTGGEPLNEADFDGQLVPPASIYEFFELLNHANIAYILRRNIADELPERLFLGKDIDLLVRPDERERVDDLLLANGYQMLGDFTINNKTALYSADSVFYLNTAEGFRLDICFHLHCASMTPNVIVPLNGAIEKKAWRDRQWDDTLGCWRLDPITELVCLVIRCIMDKHGFPDRYIYEIEKRKAWLEKREVWELLSYEFYAFTDRLMELLRQGRYSEIVPQYVTFMDY